MKKFSVVLALAAVAATMIAIFKKTDHGGVKPMGSLRPVPGSMSDDDAQLYLGEMPGCDLAELGRLRNLSIH